MLKARYGDAFIIQCEQNGHQGTIVVDGGPTADCKNAIIKKYLSLGIINLMILTHFDDDHISGIWGFAQDWAERHDQEPFPVKHMWVNNSRDYPLPSRGNLSLSQAKTLSSCLERIEKYSPDMIWRPYISEGAFIQYPFANIEVISPSVHHQEAIIKKQIEVGTNLSSIKIKMKSLKIPLEDLATTPVQEPNIKDYNQLANAASIAFILTCGEHNILFLGDCYPQNVEEYLRNKGYCETNKLKVDYVKVSHHGSKNNTSCSLLDIIDCDNYIISTDGSHRHNHPDRETMAKILCHDKRDNEQTVHFYFNYPCDMFQDQHRLFNTDESEKYNFVEHYNINIVKI